ncbi:uncharacterized protein LOC122502672 [Leptopilina heterotoma]|uniref:uncharacterized protein LOC122502672 n=1 Tax=Leptopilina heterotoma TaxID=63436 RepID=UPI001CAA3F44|nr:uncharacterized protein LOC122502672 [Leptopilina heterotoma]
MTLKTRKILVLHYFIFLIVLNYTEAKNSDCKNTFLEIMLELCHGSRLTREVHIPRDKYVLEKFHRRKRQSTDVHFQDRLTTLQFMKLPKEVGIDFILNVTDAETEDIIGEYYSRVPRSSFTKQELMDKVAKCCSNVEYCRKNPRLVCDKAYEYS